MSDKILILQKHDDTYLEISEDLMEYLKDTFASFEVKPHMTPNDIYYKAGKREDYEHLKALHETFKENKNN